MASKKKLRREIDGLKGRIILLQEDLATSHSSAVLIGDACSEWRRKALTFQDDRDVLIRENRKLLETLKDYAKRIVEMTKA
jgi:hypothetical protein